jgi:eukaryotic-like serine/threonine-protein kinase
LSADLSARLQQSLGPNYALERELGGGGMSRVFVAQDTTLRRRVVVKVLPPEMAAGVNAERFRREIQLAAQLQHPHLVPVLSAGHEGELLYYTMPFIEGESLRELVSRRGELPVADALRLLREIADALSYAHDRGIVHRDIKPENILLTTNHALVADFGIAKALSAATQGTGLTSVGMAVGTPAYMAPEQAAGDPHTDHRADLYSFGVLAYELLAGHPPFHGMAPQQLIASHAATMPTTVTEVRRAIPPQLGELVMRLLEKRPADRPQSAAEVLRELDAIAAISSGSGAATAAGGPREHASSRRRWLMASAAVLLSLLIGAGFIYSRRTVAGAALDPNLVVVAPFRVSGDPALGYLREGMLDLLGAKLTGEGGLRAAEASTVLSVWKRRAGERDGDVSQASAVRIARELGGAQVILGSIVGTASQLTLTATLLGVPSERTRATATVEGPADSLGMLVDRLAAELLARRAGARESLGSSLSTVPLPALRAFLDGRAAYRSGSYQQAGVHFSEALRRDSSFVHAAMGLIQTGNWGPVPDYDFGIRVLERERARLDARDKAHLDALLARDTWRGVSFTRQLDLWNEAVRLAPDRAEVWYELGDVYFHFGAVAQVRDWHERSRSAFGRAVELDSSFTAPLGHLLELALLEGDSAQVRSLWGTYSGKAPAAELTDYIRWRVALALNDTAQLRDVRARFAQLTMQSLLRIAGGMMLEGVGLDDAPLVTSAMRSRAASQQEVSRAGRSGMFFFLNTGQVRNARQQLEEMAQGIPQRNSVIAAFHMADALFWDGDRALGVEALPLIEARARMTIDAQNAPLVMNSACLLAQWHAYGGEEDRAEQYLPVMQRARDVITREEIPGQDWRLCPAIIEALIEVERGRPHGPATGRLDALLDEAPHWAEEALLAMARIHEVRGDLPKALATVRRRPNHWSFGPLYLTTFLREEGRLAALTGDRDGAIRAYRHFLALRQFAEPGLQPTVDHVRAELDRLERPDR